MDESLRSNSEVFPDSDSHEDDGSADEGSDSQQGDGLIMKV